MARFGALLLLALAGCSSGQDATDCDTGECAAPDDAGLLQVSQSARSVLLQGAFAPPEARNASGASMLAAGARGADGFASTAKSPLCRDVGARAWLTQNGLDFLDDYLLPTLLAQFVGKEFPKVSNTSMGFEINITELTLHSLDLEPKDIQLSFMSGRGIRMELHEFSLRLTLHYKVRGDSWWNNLLWTGGIADVTLSKDSAVSAVMGLSVNAQGHLEVSLTDTKIDLVVKDLKIRNSILGGLIEALQSFLVPLLNRMIEDKLTKWPNESLNPILADLSFRLPIPLGDAEKYGINADFSVCEVTTGRNFMAVDVYGEILSTTNPYTIYPEYPLPIPELPPLGWQDSMFALTITKWTVNSGLWLFQQLGLLSFEFTAQDLKKLNMNLPIGFDTKALGAIAPGLAKKYSEVMDVSVGISPLQAPRVLFSNNEGITVEAPQKLSFKVADDANSKPAFELKVPLAASALTAVVPKNGTDRLMVDVEMIKFTPIEVLGTTVGDVQLKLLSFILDALEKKGILPMANKALAPGIPIIGAKGIQLVGLQLQVSEFLSVMSSIDWDLMRTLREVFGSSDAFVQRVMKQIAKSMME
mmetsp:Transcript_79883/g.230920  ORF Transcript_79883/g.230920 Transcript_79883/m.230920 type:complete len:587 (-) Transcript_79883:60-1820(-)|eukprot:CAMPEP_0170259472 /NCGR_PEP_ID=MMETSP0116_2-20130129/29608_1 /TAXON_ID=400756 /ORGANISM="Durinskia baltica, Strain CSIRO CS-38" /LENGTH=586 /DNA_ID=CAMNT_0010510519 /DNA_START=59 /DNA_END=1819 /DNA_ORIENTATION=-